MRQVTGNVLLVLGLALAVVPAVAVLALLITGLAVALLLCLPGFVVAWAGTLVMGPTETPAQAFERGKAAGVAEAAAGSGVYLDPVSLSSPLAAHPGEMVKIIASKGGSI